MSGNVKDKIISLFKTNTTKDYNKPALEKNVYGGGQKSRKPKAKKCKQKTTLLKMYEIILS